MEKLWEYLIRIGGKVNMKRFFAFAMVLIFLSSVLVGCDKNNSKESNINWAIPDEIKNIQVSYNPVKYKAEVPHYDILKGLGNIENIAQFSGFSDDQKSMIEENGFVVLPGKQTKMNYLYDSNEYLGIPNFVTSDVVLHLYHQFYEKSLFYVENEYLAKDLEQLTDRMFDKSVIVFEQINDNKLKDIQKKNIAYFLVGKMIMAENPDIDVSVDSDILDLAKEEYDLIQKASGYEKSPLFDTDLDYSQFTVRGHYTYNPLLQKFFKTMMWYGFTPIKLMNMETEEFYYENTQQAQLMTYTVFLEYKGSNDIKTWNNIYEPTGFYVGQSDDLNIMDLKELIVSVFGENVDIEDSNNSSYHDKLYEAVKNLREPEIKAKITNAPVAKEFKFMGQRYILDGYIMQELMDPYLRPVPTGLDVMGVLGSKQGEDLLFNNYQPQKQWPDYQKNYDKLKNEVKSYKNEIWQSNLYNGWLWAIQKEIMEFDENSGMPVFMTNESWRNKSLNAALSSYAELKHDTVLYGKQPVAEMGGPMEVADQHYVEPNVELYDNLLWLMEYTVKNLEARKLLNDDFKDGAEKNIELLKLLRDCSVKELKNENLTEDEKNKLLWIGGTLENISNSYSFGASASDKESFSIEQNDMIIADVATLGNNKYLNMGTGFFDEIYVAVPVEGKLYLTRGIVYSYYEFVGDKRLTDEEWWDLQGLKKVKEDSYEYFRMEEPSKNLPDQPFWVNIFKSDSNNVKIESLEVDWDKINE